ncbi:nischarin-like [Sinocyclocheilus grahami]|uniref:nischarin-like n=1 Tax=Sinocyclocheilus grahami TaxID=75366 RepID=UPI0007AD1857|nr:PREDICTED: nischarin-like [Sinocyclocheilus grahami]
MDAGHLPEPCAEKRVRIVGSELVESYTVYIIEVYVGDHSWTVKHRYSDFHDLHEKLTVEKKIDKHLLPPKKIIGKNSKSLVEKRQKELEVYLQTLLSRFPASTPKVLSKFLLFHLYEISGIAAALAEELFHKGEQLLAAGEVFLLRPLQLYAVTQQLKLAKPTCANGDAKADLGHILDFTCRLKYLKIPGMKAAVGTSNIGEQILPFDLSIFKSLLQIEISDCDAGQIKGLPSLKPTLATLSIHLSASSMKEILVPEASEFAQWEPEGVDTDCPVTAIIPTWKMLTTLDMSRNFIRCIDESVKLIPEVEFLDLSYNELSLVENLQHLYNLVHLDLSFNKLTVLEGVHTKLGNIKTLNLSGNQLDTLSGLSKLYSLVNLDLSSNKLAQMDEIKNIGTLPCLEKLSLADNPMCIIPDYRTKVLAQFCDRASEVCLDGTTTTEKELDTVEVLKAIQKAKEAKDRMANNEKKNGFCFPSVSLSEITTCKEKAFITKEILTPVDSTLSQRCYDVYSSACDIIQQVKTQIDSSLSSEVTFESSPCCCEEEWKPWTANLSNLFVPPPLLSYATTNQEFTNQLSAHLSQANIEESTPIPCKTTTLEGTDQGSPQSGDGYFEMTIDDTNEIMGCSSSSTIQENMPDDVKKESAVDNVKMVVWSLCISVGEGLSQRPTCLVATDSSLVVFHTRSEEPVSTLEELMENLETDLVVPYTNIETFQFDIPEVCFSLKVKSSNTRWFFFSGAQSLKEMHCCIVPHVDQTNEQVLNSSNTQVFIRQFLNSWDFEESEGSVKGGHLIHFLDLDSSTSNKNVANNPQFPKNSATLDVLSQIGLFESGQNQTSNPMILFLTSRHLCILKVDFVTLASRDPSEASAMRSCSKVTRIPLSFTLLDPKQDCSCRAVSDSRRFYNEHVVELMAGHERLTVVFALPQDKFTFQIEFTQLRSNLREIKTIALQRTKKGHSKVHSCPAPATATERIPTSSVPQEVPRPHLTLSLLYPAKSLIQQLMEDNQCPSHFSLSSSLLLISSLKGDQLVHFFHDNIAEMENEELKHILWTSVLFYRSPDVETTACVLLSTKAIYFVLDDTASSLTNQSMMWTWNPSEHKDTDFLFSFCFTLKLKDLQSVNVGLFDQYFRVVGPSADHIISCLTRDGYGTHRFLQQLMMVLTLLEKVPSPEPSELDFYSQFGNKSTGKMENYELVHSSKVKFVYPSEEEIGDLTFIVAERKTPQAPSHSFNILLYVLVFQVHVVPGQTAQNQTVLQPKTLILTSTDVFLLDEDHISYPLPEFAKEPPQRDKYRLTDARRIRDLDRVLMGYQTYPQALTLVFDDVPGPDLLCHLTMDHFAESDGKGDRTQGVGGAEGEVQWCIFVPGADSRERLISLLARQWETLCSRELPVELTG